MAVQQNPDIGNGVGVLLFETFVVCVEWESPFAIHAEHAQPVVMEIKPSASVRRSRCFSDSSHDRCLDAVRRNLFDWPSSESATGKHGSDTRRRSQEHSAFQARQHLLPGTLPGVGQRRPRRVCDGYGQETAVLEHSHCQYHQHPARDGHVRHAGGDARVGQGRRAGRFCGGGGTPLFSANELDVEVAWFAPQSEYRPTEYLQAWVRFWFDDGLRLHAAKQLQAARLQCLHAAWTTRHARVRFRGGRRTSDGAAAASRYADRQCAGRHRVAGRRSAAD